VTGIFYAALDGSAGGRLNTAGATVNTPEGVAVDPAAGRIYWANNGASTLSWAALDGSGGGDLAIYSATVDHPTAVAVDHAAGRIYWTQGAHQIVYAQLDGSGGGEFPPTGETRAHPVGLAIDHDAGLTYFGQFGGPISYAKLDGSGGGDLGASGATFNSPLYPVLLKPPLPAGAATVTGRSGVGSVLTCSASWEGDAPGAFLYRAPAAIAYSWSRDGASIGGATTSTYTARQAGGYSCGATGSNAAGTGSQTSPPHPVAPPSFGPRTLVTLSLKRRRIRPLDRLRIRVRNKNAFAISGRLRGKAAGHPALRLKPAPVHVQARRRSTVKLRLSARARRRLVRQHKLRVGLVATVRDPAGNARKVSKRVTVRLKRPM
jgi:hypothetical protein